MGCKLTQPKLNSCTKKQKQGGLDSLMWLFNAEDVTYEEATAGVVTAINLPSGEQLFRIDGDKFASSFGHSFEKPNINSFFPQTLSIVSIVDTAEDLAWLNSVLRAEKLGAVVIDNNRQIKLLGQYSGMMAESGDSFNSGNEQGADIGTTVTLSGAESGSPFKFVDLGDFQTTKDYLVTLETAV